MPDCKFSQTSIATWNSRQGHRDWRCPCPSYGIPNNLDVFETETKPLAGITAPLWYSCDDFELAKRWSFADPINASLSASCSGAVTDRRWQFRNQRGMKNDRHGIPFIATACSITLEQVDLSFAKASDAMFTPMAPPACICNAQRNGNACS